MTMNIVTTLGINTVVFSVLFGLMVLFRKLLSGKISVVMQYALLGVVVLKLMIPFGFESAISPLSWFDHQSAFPETVQSQAWQPQPDAYIVTDQMDDADHHPSYQTPHKPVQSLQEETSQSTQAAIKTAWLHWSAWVCIVWVAGTLVMLLWLSLSMWIMRRRIRHTKTDVPANIVMVFEACKKELGIKRHIGLVMQTALPVPAVTGLIHPTLIVPDRLTDMAPATLRNIFLHELTHYKHGDLIVIRMMNGLNSLYWFNPLVWLCFKLMRRDMETICDQRCLRLMDKDTQSGYVDTVLQFAGMPSKKRLQAAIAITDGRTNLEKRIRSMFTIRRTRGAIRILVMVAAAMVLVTCVLTACQPTPEEAVVIGKGDGLSDLIQSTASASGGVSATSSDGLYTKLNAPEHWNLETMALGDKLNITADVDIELPGVSQLPAATASLSEFTQEDLDKIANVFGVKECAVWTEIGVQTKEQIEEGILDYQARRAEYKAEGNDELVKHMDENIEAYKLMYEDAPSESELKNIDFKISQLTPDGDDTFGIGFMGITQVDGTAFFFLTDNSYSGERINRIFANFGTGPNGFGGVDIDKPYGVSLSKEQAAEQATKIAAQLTDELSLCYITPAATGQDDSSRNWGWACVFMREINGCPTAYETTEIGSSLEAVEVPVDYEKMIIVMDDEGMVSFEWEVPMTIESIDNTDVSLLSFDEISQRAIDQIAQRYADTVAEDIDSNGIDWGDPKCTANIKKVKLGLMRVAKANSNDFYYYLGNKR